MGSQSGRMYTNLLIMSAQLIPARVVGEVVEVLLGIPSTADDVSQVDVFGSGATSCHVEVLSDRVTIAAEANSSRYLVYFSKTQVRACNIFSFLFVYNWLVGKYKNEKRM